ncbi:MAG: hypothetical protein ACJ8F7_21180 [Gemmataceae bacterium]
MCCFSKNVRLVADTNIFARAAVGGLQYLVYSMKVASDEPVAMILPLPTPKGSSEDAVTFINLEKYADFFDDMRAGFPVPKDGRGRAGSLSAPAGKIAVVQVGSFIASFVPSQKDFARVDEQFKLPPQVWDKFPQYKDWGFAVFQLKKGEQKVHPMAFEFPRRNPKHLFFPTVHIHDGTVKPKAHFDHMLFAQFTGGESEPHWEETPQPAEMFMKKLGEAKGVVAAKEHVYRKIMQGNLKNEDVMV